MRTLHPERQLVVGGTFTAGTHRNIGAGSLQQADAANHLKPYGLLLMLHFAGAEGQVSPGLP